MSATSSASAVTVAVRDAVKDESEDDVEEDGAACDHHHGDRVDLELAVGDPVRRQVHQHARHVPDDDDGEEGAERLGAVVPERVLLAAGSAAKRLHLSNFGSPSLVEFVLRLNGIEGFYRARLKGGPQVA